MSDVLSKRVLDIGETVWFTRASAEEPTTYVRFRGTVKAVIAEGDHISYHVQVNAVLESLQFIKDYIHQKSFRVISPEKKYRMLKMFYIWDILTAKDFVDSFRKKFADVIFDIPMVLAFESKEELDKNTIRINNHLISKLKKHLEELNKNHDRL